MRITHIGGPTALIELDGWRLLTDPTFDAAGGKYSFGYGSGSRKLSGPALSPADLGRIDVVLLSHDHHDDNLDAAGREVLRRGDTVVTTAAGARRLGDGARGLSPGETTRLKAAGRPPLEITATPCRHGPPLSGPIVGDVVGFAIRRPGEERVALWISGDTVLYRGVREAARAMSVDVALVHLGAARFGVTGPLRYTLTAQEAAELCELCGARVAIPIHYEGWSHFRQGREEAEAVFARASPRVRGAIRWLAIGEPSEIG